MADHLSPADSLAGGHHRRDRFVRRPQPAAVLDGHEFAVREPPREHHDTVTGRQYRPARGAFEVGAAMPRTERRARRGEGAQHRMRRRERPREPPRPRLSLARREQGCDQASEHERDQW
jgi:hypothetical protein